MGARTRSLRIRLSVWFSLGVLVIMACFSLATFYHLREELILEKSKIEHPDQPDYVLHGSMDSDTEIREILRDLLLKTAATSGPLLLVLIALGWFLAGRSLRPIADLNRQLEGILPRDLTPQKLVLEESDREFQEHVAHLNDLLGRLGKSFDDLREYAAKVAHELRTPITILRLKVESSESDIAPELRGLLLDELARLQHVVDQSLLIARAEQGTIEWELESFDLAPVLRDLVGDFGLLAAESGRDVTLNAPGSCVVRSDARYIKQILQGYLTNALKHGAGTVGVSLTESDGVAHVGLNNQLKDSPRPEASTLGLGLRVINALVASQEAVTARTARSGDQFRSELTIPTAV